jgi:hypothetical protein
MDISFQNLSDKKCKKKEMNEQEKAEHLPAPTSQFLIGTFRVGLRISSGNTLSQSSHLIIIVRFCLTKRLL